MNDDGIKEGQMKLRIINIILVILCFSFYACDKKESTMKQMRYIVDLIEDSHKELSKEQIEGIDVNLTLDNENTLLILASYNNKPETVKILIESGADITHTNKDGNNAFDVAIQRHNSECAKIILKQIIRSNMKIDTSNKEYFFDACDMRNTELVNLLVELGYDYNVVDNKGWNCLMYALNGSPPVSFVEYLLDLGIDVNHKNNHGDTALLMISRFGKIEDYVRILIEHGAKLNLLDANGNTALDNIYKHSKNSMAIKLLINEGAKRSEDL